MSERMSNAEAVLVMIGSLSQDELAELRVLLREFLDDDGSGDREPRDPVGPLLSGGAEAELED